MDIKQLNGKLEKVLNEEIVNDDVIKNRLETYIKKYPNHYENVNVLVNNGVVKLEKDGKVTKKAFIYDDGAVDNKGNDWNECAFGNLMISWKNQVEKEVEEKSAKYEVIYHLEGDIKLIVAAENEEESVRKAYDKLRNLYFGQLDHDYGLNYKCIKNDLI